MSEIAFVALGANLDDPVSQVRRALLELDDIPATRVIGRSSLYRTLPVGPPGQPAYINAVAKLETALMPRALLAALLELESRHGRRRSVRNAPRTLDLDLLLYGGLVLEQEGLSLPHPRMHVRAFVLAPLAEIAPQVNVPGHGGAGELLAKTDRSGVELLNGA